MISPAGGSGPNPLEGYPREIHSCATLNAVSRPRRRIRHVELLRNRCFTAAGNQVRTPLPLMWLCSARMVGEGPSRNPSCVCPNLAWSARMVAGPGFDPAQETGWLSTLPVGAAPEEVLQGFGRGAPPAVGDDGAGIRGGGVEKVHRPEHTHRGHPHRGGGQEAPT